MTSRRPRTVRALLLVLALAVSVTASAQAPGALATVADQIAALFPRVEADVLEVQGERLTLSVGRRDGVQAGIELAMFREGRELRHPRTGESLGRTEQDLGRAVIEEVAEAYAIARLSRGGDVKVGDRGRVSAGKLRLTVVPLVDGVKPALAEAAVQELAEALGKTGRFHVAMGDAIAVGLAQAGVKPEDALEGAGLKPLAERYRSEHLLLVHLTRQQTRPYMDLRLFSFPASSRLLSTALFVPPSVRAAPRGDFSGSGGARDSQTPRPQRSLLARLFTGDSDTGAYSAGESTLPLREIARFPFVATAIDAALAPVDRVSRLVVSDGQRIYLYRLGERALEPEWTYTADSRARVFAVQLADLDGDGVLEVIVNRYSPNPGILVSSLILTTRERRPVVLVRDVARILYALDATGDGVKRLLWGQEFAQATFFRRGDAERYTAQDGRLVAEGRVRVPASFRATGAVMAGMGKGPRALAYVDEHNRLRIAVETEDVWRSSAPVGTGPAKLEVVTQVERGGRSFLHQPEVAPVAVDLDGDGVDEVVVAQNQIPGRVAVVYKGPGGYRFQTVNTGFEGVIVGLGATPNPDGPPTLLAAVLRQTGLLSTTGETQIIVTTPSE